MTDHLPAPSIVLLHGARSSRLTWWRIEQDLHDLGWDTQALDLLGHGERSGTGPDDLDLDLLADDVLDRIDRPIDLLAGHALGAIVALQIAQRRPAPMRGLLLEDPPARGGADRPAELLNVLASAAQAATTAPFETRTRLLEDHPLWAQPDAENALLSGQRTDVARVGAMLLASEWNLPALIRGASVPICLLLADQHSALDEPDRNAVIASQPPGRAAVIASGPTIHRDRPALWVHHATRFLDSLES